MSSEVLGFCGSAGLSRNFLLGVAGLRALYIGLLGHFVLGILPCFGYGSFQWIAFASIFKPLGQTLNPSRGSTVNFQP